jgi:hypothetical protein
VDCAVFSSLSSTFDSENGGVGGPSIDNVRVTDAPDVPEPASLALMLFGGATLLLAKLRR